MEDPAIAGIGDVMDAPSCSGKGTPAVDEEEGIFTEGSKDGVDGDAE